MSGAADELRARDERARWLAQTEFSRPIVLEAGAGTGKTATLVARVVCWSLGAGWEQAAAELDEERREGPRPNEPVTPESVAARVLDGVVLVTFTEAAAAEMATRVGHALARLEGEARDAGVELPAWLDRNALPADASTRGQRARCLLGALDRLTARTIHSFCMRLLARWPVEANLPPRFEIDADERATHEAAHELIAETLAGHAGAVAGDGEVASDVSEVATGLVVLAAEGVDPATVRDELVRLVVDGVGADAFDDDPLDLDRIDAMLSALHQSSRLFLAAGGSALANGSPTSVRVAQSVADLAARLEDGASLEEACELAAPAAAERARIDGWARGDFNKTDAKKVGDELEAVSAAAASLAEALLPFAKLDPARVRLVRSVYRPLFRELRARLRRKGILSHGDLLREASELLQRQPGVAALARSRIRQLLVDEFQDTDEVQCEIVRRLALADSGDGSGDGRGDGRGDRRGDERPGLFLVGDPKQSIYGWRRADLTAWSHFVGLVEQAGGCRLPLAVNFRSLPSILEEVQAVVEPVMRPEEGVQPHFEPLLPCDDMAREEQDAPQDAPPAVEYWDARPLDDDGAPRTDARAADVVAVESAALADDLARCAAQGTRWSDMAVLLRSTSDLDVVLGALREAGVPYAVAKDRSYYRRREVIEAAALVRCVFDPLDHLALLALTRSVLAGVPDCALVPLWARQLPKLVTELDGRDDVTLDRLREAIGEVSALVAEEPGVERVAGWGASFLGFLEALSALRGMAHEATPIDVVETLRALLAPEATSAARWLGRFRVANLDRFFRELLDDLADGEADLGLVLRRLRSEPGSDSDESEGRPKDEAEDAVEVMTIHGAKGLDFEHVHVMQCAKGRNRPEREGRLAVRVGSRWEWSLAGARTPGRHLADRRAGTVERAERVRLLYVAMTRAKRRLVLSGDWAGVKRDVEPADAWCFAHLVAHRRGAPSPDELHGRLAAGEIETPEGEPWPSERDGRVAWRFPAAARDGARRAGSPAIDEAAWPSIDETLEIARRLEAARAEARRRARRVRFGSPSGAAHDDAGADQSAVGERDEPSHLSEIAERRAAAELEPEQPDLPSLSDLADPSDSSDPSGPSDPSETDEALRSGNITPGPGAMRPGLARAVGTTIHRVLEVLPLDGDIADALRAEGDRIAEHARVHASGSALSHEEVASRSRALLEAMSGGEIAHRLARVAPHVVARELPVLLPVDPSACDGPVGYLSGSIDLVHRDPDDGEIVVVDYKTEPVGDDDAAERARRHAPQLALYARAVREALDLPALPRAEVWFLAGDRIERVDID